MKTQEFSGTTNGIGRVLQSEKAYPDVVLSSGSYSNSVTGEIKRRIVILCLFNIVSKSGC